MTFGATAVLGVSPAVGIRGSVADSEGETLDPNLGQSGVIASGDSGTGADEV